MLIKNNTTMACQIKVDFEKAEALKSLYDYCGTNCTQFYSYLTTVVKSLNSVGEIAFTPKFVKEWENSHPNEELNIHTTNTDMLRDAIVEFYNKTYPSIREGMRDVIGFDKVKSYGYPNITAREECKKFFANKIIEYEREDFTLKGLKVKNKKGHLCSRGMGYFINLLANRLSRITGVDKKEIIENYLKKDNNTAALNDFIKEHTVKPNLQLQTLLALYNEFSNTTLHTGLEEENIENDIDTNPRIEFLDEVCYDSRIQELHLGELKSEDDAIMETAQDESNPDDSEQDGATATKEIEYDQMIYILENKLGLTSTFMAHVSNDIKSLLGSLPKMTTTELNDGEFVLDKDNYLGIPDVMDAHLCATVLYHYSGIYTSPEEMLKGIKDIAERVPGMAGFIKLHEILNKNDDLLVNFYRTFSKLPISKIETIVDGTESKNRLTNENIDILHVLKFRFINSIKTTALSEPHDKLYSDVTLLKEDINNYSKYDNTSSDKLKELCDKVANYLKRYYPTLDDVSIRHYVMCNKNSKGNINYGANLASLCKDLIDTIEAAKGTSYAYDERIGQIAIARKHNSDIRNGRISDEFIDLNPLYATSYITKNSESAAIKLAKKLVPFTLIDVPLDSRNTLGNRSSDVINSSMITNVMHILESRLNTYTEGKDKNGHKTKVWDKDIPIVKLAEHRFQSKQYDFSNILLERVGDDGKILNYGIFREIVKDDGSVEYIPSEHATELIKIRLFNGASNLNDNTSALYKDMSRGDYLATSWINFFNTSNTIENGPKVADYFLRIPSDAPKNFVITAPRYDIKGLLSAANAKEIKDNIDKFINTVSEVIAKGNDTSIVGYRLPIRLSNSSKTLNLATFVSHLETDDAHRIDIQIPINRQSNKGLKGVKGETVQIAFRWSPNDITNVQQNTYVMEGVYSNGVLHDAKFVGFIRYNQNKDHIDDNIWGDVRKQLYNNKAKNREIKWQLNTNHAIYKQFINVFRQELTDMATASSVMFETTEDNDRRGLRRIKVDDNGHPILKVGELIQDNNNHNGLHPIYHFADPKDDNKGAIYTVDEDGVAHATGKVFTSDRFVLFDYFAENGEEAVHNYGQDILNEAFGLFRRRTSNPDNILMFDKNGNVVLSDEQTRIMNDYIQKFILDYIEYARERMKEYDSFITDETAGKIDTNAIADFILNTHLMYVSCNDLFEGDTKFYKDVQTFLKRAKETQGSGVPYGLIDFNKAIQPGHNAIPSALDNATFNTLLPNGLREYQMYDTFSAITIFNTVRTDTHMLDLLVKNLTNKDVMGRYTLTEDRAKELLYGPIQYKNGKPVMKNGQAVRKGGYQDTTINDAQSYITFKEWVRRITARGQLSKYKDLIERLLDESKELRVEDLEEFIQVQKNFYYDQYYNQKTKVVSPRQIKNAEFVLVPRLIKGTELEKVAEMMDKLGIDQLNTSETSKAAQSEKFTLWDENGHISQELLADLEQTDPSNYTSDIMRNGANAIEYYNYAYLYTQQETPQHIDSENKAGLQIIKKLLDNIDENSPEHIRKAKEEFLNLLSENIKDSYTDLMSKLGVKLDIDGNIIINENGEIEGLKYDKLFKLLKDELSRLGLDSNLADYCTQDIRALGINSAQTVMPNYFSLVANKFENIVQSVFNNNITRQVLPGFHAAQISGMGFRKLSDQVDSKQTSNILQYHPQLYKNIGTEKEISEREYNKLTNEEKKNYTKSRIAQYVEIQLPAANFGFKRNSEQYKNLTKEEQDALFLKELQEQHLDEIIGYRIPTEGKQSVCCMKVVGFTDDAYGSTIVVPDAWVSQTGSDFDIDTVYGIQYRTYIDKAGHIKKYEYKTSFNEFDWFRYIYKHTGIQHESLSKEEFANIKNRAKQYTKEELKERKKTYRNTLQETEENFYNVLDDDTKTKIDEIRANIDKRVKNKHNNYKGELTSLIVELNKYRESVKEKYSEEQLENFDNYIYVLDEILADLNNSSNARYNQIKSEAIKKEIDKFKEERFNEYKKDAKEHGLMSYEEFLEQAEKSPYEFNTKYARDNKILDALKTILSDPSSFEENLSRSNFDDIIASLDKCVVGNDKNRRSARSSYNIFDQADFQEDAMSGASLKAFSVTRDTFCSVCNAVHPILANNSEIKVFYRGDQYDIETLKARFGDEKGIVTPSKGGFIVTHKMIGWSKDNKNIDGRLITPYSSETTAHILDAIKRGNVPNVNLLTFQVYKTLVDIGSNYDTAISFIMQPGVRRIVDAYNKTNSIYSEEKGHDYILQAVRSILDDLHIDYRITQNLDDLLVTVNNVYGVAAQHIFGEKFVFSVHDDIIGSVPLDFDMQLQRLKQEGIFAEDDNKVTKEQVQLLYDLQTILQYGKIDKLADDISEAARLSNPDKFGAKQTLFATRQVFNNIVRSINNNIDKEGLNSFRLQVDGKHVLNAIYPEIENASNGEDALNIVLNSANFIKDSKYKTLAAFLKYATATSIKINKSLFLTQSDEFVNLIMDEDLGLQSKLSHGNYITEKIAKDFQNYLVNYIVLKSGFIQSPIKYNVKKGEDTGFVYDRGILDYNHDEAIRVFGYGHSAGLKARVTGKDQYDNTVTVDKLFEVEDINDPTQDEINEFNTMSPAQKVLWIKRHFRDTGVFGYIDVQLFNEYSTRGKKAGTQTMEFNESANNIETVYREFEQAFTHTNPLVACAAADIIKYAFIVEGYKMGMGNVSKMISNKVLIRAGQIYGTGIVDDSNFAMNKLADLIHVDKPNNVLENYIRSHSTTSGVNYRKVQKVGKDGYELTQRSYGIIHLNGTTEAGFNLGEKYGILYSDNSGVTQYNPYVRLGFGKKQVLYKVIKKETNSDIVNYFLIPLNLLDSSENVEFSANASNNLYPNQEFYNTVIDEYWSLVTRMTPETKGIYNQDVMVSVVKEKAKNIDNYIAKNDFKSKDKEAQPIDQINDPDGTYRNLVDAINERDWPVKDMEKNRPIKFIKNAILDKYIKGFGIDNGFILENVPIKAGGLRSFRVYKYGVNNLVKRYTGENINSEIRKEDIPYTEVIELLRKIARANSYNMVSPFYSDIYAIEPVDLRNTFEPISFDPNASDSKDYIVEEHDENYVSPSSFSDVLIESGTSVYRRSYNLSDILAGNIARFWNNKGVSLDDKEVQEHAIEILPNTAKYITSTAEAIENKLYHFTQDPDTKEWLKVDDIRCINIVKKNPKLREEYLKLIQEPETLVQDFGLIKELDIDSEDSAYRSYLMSIKKAVEKMQNLSIIGNAYELFAKEWFDKLSTNPYIEEGLMSVLDGYYKTNWLAATFNDIQETANPIVQVGLKHFQADLAAKERAARARAEEFIKHILEIKRKAEQAGKTFDLNNVIDEYGNWVKNHTAQFIEDRNKFQERLREAEKKSPLEFLEVKLEYDRWKVAHIEQPLKKEYYLEKIDALDDVLHGTKSEEVYRTWAAKNNLEGVDDEGLTVQDRLKAVLNKTRQLLNRYEQLRRERANIRDTYKSDSTNPEYGKQMAEINEKIKQLLDTSDITSEIERSAINRINAYIKTTQDIEHKYFKYVPNYGFDELLKKNLEIVDSYESSNRPVNLYINEPEYVNAKRWIAENVIREPIYEEDEFGTVEPVDVRNELHDAYRVLGNNTSLPYAKKVKQNTEYRTSYGEFDPTKVSEEDRAKVKKEQQINYRTNDEPVFSDRILISNGNPNGEIYNSKFYKGMVTSTSKTANPKHIEIVSQINDILGFLYDKATGDIKLQLLNKDEETLSKWYGTAYIAKLKNKHDTADARVAVLKELRFLYNELGKIKANNVHNKIKSQTVKAFIEKNVEFDTNTDKCNADRRYANSLFGDSEFKQALLDVILNIRYVKKGKGKVEAQVIANSWLYGYIRPKDNVKTSFIDKDKTDALEIINKYTEKVLDELYYVEEREAKKQGDEAYDKWRKENHIFNPYSHSVEPIAIWWHTRPKAKGYNNYPSYGQAIRTIRDGYLTHKEAEQTLEKYDFDTTAELENHYFEDKDYNNPNYNPNGGHEANYIFGSDSKYDATYKANEYELEAMKYIQNILVSLANTQDAKRYIERGKLPVRSKYKPDDVKGWMKEFAKLFGWSHEGYNPNDWYEDVNLAKDRPNPMPMLEELKGKFNGVFSKDIRRKPVQQEDETEEEYSKRVKKWEEETAKIKKDNAEIHKNIMDRDWISVISDFIVKAGMYNAIQDNKYELFFMQKLLKRYGSYVLTYGKNGKERFKRLRYRSEEEGNLLRQQDEELLKQFNNYLRRVLYNQFKKTNSPLAMKIASTFQNLTSAQFMMLNVKGGIANVTVGESNIGMEIMAKQYFNEIDYAKGTGMYMSCIHDFLLHAYDDKAGTVGGAVVKYMEILDYDERRGVSDNSDGAMSLLKNLRNLGYIPQTSGEHAMQNKVLLTMMFSHRLVENPKAAELGQPDYVAMSFADYSKSVNDMALKSILNDKEKEQYEKFKKAMSNDKTEFREFAWYSRDLTSEFVRTLSRDRQKEWYKTKKELKKTLKTDFEDDIKHPTLISQMTVNSEGKLDFIDGSLLSQCHVRNGDNPTQTEQILAEFRNKVISVNKYIHGVYDKSGRAQLENTLLGSLIMQYHKHIPVGLMKRYKVMGMYNEERGTVTKGMYKSLIDFIKIPFTNNKAKAFLTKEERDAGVSIQNFFKGLISFVVDFKLNYNSLPDYDQANMRRIGAELATVLAGLFLTIIIKAAADDDDEDGLFYNLAIYEADRLTTQAVEFSPLGRFSELRKQWQSPIAANSWINDIMASGALLAHMIIDGKDFDGEYHSGKYAGENKFKVYLTRRIPIWRGINSSFIEIKSNNKYYKIGENALDYVDVNAAAKDLKNMFE